MVVSNIPALRFTPVEQIQGSISTLRESFAERKTRDIEFRLVQLRKLYWAYVIQATPEFVGRIEIDKWDLPVLKTTSKKLPMH